MQKETGKSVELASSAHSLKLNEEAVRAGAQTDLDDLGIAKNAREEQIAARAAATARSLEDKLKEDAKHKQMAELYRQHVLKEAPKPPVIQIQGLKKSQPSV